MIIDQDHVEEALERIIRSQPTTQPFLLAVIAMELRGIREALDVIAGAQ